MYHSYKIFENGIPFFTTADIYIFCMVEIKFIVIKRVENFERIIKEIQI